MKVYTFLTVVLRIIVPLLWQRAGTNALIKKENTTDDGSVLTITTVAHLNGLCEQLNITLEDCSCAKTEALCPFESIVKNILNVTEVDYKRSNTYTIIYVCLTILVSIFGLIGNLAVMIIAFSQRHSHFSACKLHIAQLAVVNFIFSILQIVNAVPLIWTNQWIYGLTMCKFLRTFLEMCTLLTILFILIIAVQRFVLIVYPNKSDYFEGYLKHCIAVCAILFVTITVIPFFIGLHIEESGRCVQFGSNYKQFSLPYSWFVIVVYFLLPGVIVTSLYMIIIMYISRQTSNIDRNHNCELHQKKTKRNRRVVYITFTILFCFLICTLPTRSSLLYIEMQSKRTGLSFIFLNPDLYFTLTFISYITYPFQSSVNPVLYSFVDSEWRTKVRKYIGSILGGCQERHFVEDVVVGNNILSLRCCEQNLKMI